MVRGKLVGLVLVFVASGLVVGSGAFTTVSSQRTATVDTAGDASALLRLTPYAGPGGNGDIADIQNHQIQISNLNVASSTTFAKVYNVTNQGTQPVAVWVVDEGDHPGAVTFYNPTYGGSASTENGVASVEGQANAVNLDVGEPLVVSLAVDTSGLGEGVALLDAMIVHADASEEGALGPGDAGVGNGDAAEDGNDDGEGAIRVTPDESAEPVTIVGGSQTFTIHNDGDGSLSVTVSLVGADADAFEIASGATSTTIPAGSNHQIGVEADDPSDGSTATVRFSSDAGDVERDVEDKPGGPS